MRLIFGIAALLVAASCDHTDADLEYARGVCAKIGPADMQGCVERQFAERQNWRARMAGAMIAKQSTATCTTVGTQTTCRTY